MASACFARGAYTTLLYGRTKQKARVIAAPRTREKMAADRNDLPPNCSELAGFAMAFLCGWQTYLAAERRRNQ